MKQIKDGDILHCKSNSVLSKLIRYFTKGRYSHTALVISLEGILFIVDSQHDGTRIRTFEAWKNTYNYKYKISRPLDPKQKLLQEVKEYINTSYGYGDMLRHLFLSYTGIWLGSKRESKHLICSEFVMRIYGMKDAYRANPTDAYIWCLENDFKTFNQ